MVREPRGQILADIEITEDPPGSEKTGWKELLIEPSEDRVQPFAESDDVSRYGANLDRVVPAPLLKEPEALVPQPSEHPVPSGPWPWTASLLDRDAVLLGPLEHDLGLAARFEVVPCLEQPLSLEQALVASVRAPAREGPLHVALEFRRGA